jgi:hypothetical protein
LLVRRDGACLAAGADRLRGRLDKKATSISLLVALGVMADGKKFCLPSRTWAAKAKRLGLLFSTISSNAACERQSL